MYTLFCTVSNLTLKLILLIPPFLLHSLPMSSFPKPDKLNPTSLTCLLSPSPSLVLSQFGSAVNRPGQSLPQQRLQLSSALQQQQQALQQQQQQIQVIQQLHPDCV